MASDQSSTVLEVASPKARIAWASPAVLGLLASTIVFAGGTIVSAILGARHATPQWWPFVVLVLSVGLVITLITIVRVHAFLALIIAAMAAGLISGVGILPNEAKTNHWVQAVELTTVGLGETAGNIGVVIALASVIGMCLLESGAADKVVRRFLALFGVKHAGLALLVSTYIVSIPIFFDTIFMLLVPLAKAMRLRTGKNYVLYVLAICCAGLITHSMVIPHPGPAAMARTLQVDEGLTIVVGWCTGMIPMALGWLVVLWINSRIDVPLVESRGATREELEAMMNKSEDELPPLWLAVLPVLLPVFLISAASMLTMFGRMCPWLFPAGTNRADLLPALQFIGNRNTALLIGTIIAVATLMHQRGLNLPQVADLIAPPLETAGVIILITAAGGAFGYMLRSAGVGDAIKNAASGHQINLIVLAWLVAVVIRIAQGSATVAMLTTAGMIYPLIQGAALPFHPVYMFLAIGYGAMGISWMNDSGFWVVSRLGGMTEKQTLRTWTVMVGAVSIAGLITTLVLSTLLPFAQK